MISQLPQLPQLPHNVKHFAKEYFGALLLTPQIFRHTAFRKRTLEEELQEALLRGSLRKAFGGLDLVLLGLGIVIGSGWAQLSGVAGQYAGPAVIVSYLVSGLAALFAACCYAELCLEYPVSGGAFSYVMVTFGELAAFITLAGLLLEYALGMAAVARGFSTYLAVLCNQDPTKFVLEVNGNKHTFDFAAAGIILIMSVLLSLGVRESAFFISGMTIVKIVLLLFVAIAGYTKGDLGNMNPFFDPQYDVDGMFIGAAIIFFSYTGFDAIGNAAEEVQDVTHLPWALVGTVGTAGLLYVLLALSLVLMSYPNIACPNQCLLTQYGTLNFITAFMGNGLSWMKYIVALAALSGILTALTVGMFSASRIVMVASRDWLLPPVLSRISPRTQTPLMAQIVLGVIISLLAMLVEVDQATSLVSFGTLIALWLVCNAQLYRRYWPDTQLRFTRYGTVEAAPKEKNASGWVLGSRLPVQKRKLLVWVHILVLNAIAIALAVFYQENAVYANPLQGSGAESSGAGPGAGNDTCPPADRGDGCPGKAALRDYHHSPAVFWFVLAWFLVTLSFQLCCPLEYEPAGWHVPWWLMPWLPATGICLIIFSVGALPTGDYWKIGVYFGGVLAAYLFMALPMSYIKHSKIDYVNKEELNVVELAYVQGQWQPTRVAPMSMYPMPSVPSRSSEYKLEMPGTRSGSGSSGGVGRPADGKPPLVGVHAGRRSPAAQAAGRQPAQGPGPVKPMRPSAKPSLPAMHEADETMSKFEL